MYNYIIIHTVCAEQLQEVILGKLYDCFPVKWMVKQ